MLLVLANNAAYNQQSLFKNADHVQHFLKNSVGYNQHFRIFAGKMKIPLWKHYL